MCTYCLLSESRCWCVLIFRSSASPCLHQLTFSKYQNCGDCRDFVQVWWAEQSVCGSSADSKKPLGQDVAEVQSKTWEGCTTFKLFNPLEYSFQVYDVVGMLAASKVVVNCSRLSAPLSAIVRISMAPAMLSLSQCQKLRTRLRWNRVTKNRQRSLLSNGSVTHLKKSFRRVFLLILRKQL